MAATMTEIAREAEVSVPLVSRFLNNDPTLRISDEKRTRIERAKAKLGGVRIRRTTRSVRKKLAYKISIPVNRIFSPEWVREYYVRSEHIQAFEATLRSRNFRVSINFFEEEERLTFLKDLAPTQGYCDGFLIEGRIIDQDIAAWLIQNQIPHVSTDPRVEKFGVNTVFEHKISGLHQSIEHLLELGHRRIGYVGVGELGHLQFLSAMAGKQVPVHDEDWCELTELTPRENLIRFREHTRKVFSQWFQPGQGPTAVICGNDHIAFGVIDVLKDRGLSPGKDLSIVGYDNIERRGPKPSEHPILTTIDQPFDLVGRRCAERLLEQILQGQRNIVHEYIPVNLVIRESTQPCRVTK